VWVAGGDVSPLESGGRLEGEIVTGEGKGQAEERESEEERSERFWTVERVHVASYKKYMYYL
jgi:hypothetical protein